MTPGGGYVFKSPHHITYHSLKRRGNKRALATTAGDRLGEKIVQCVVDCDSDDVTINKLPSGGGLSISLRKGGLRLRWRLLHDDRNLG